MPKAVASGLTRRPITIRLAELPPTLEIGTGLIGARCYKDKAFRDSLLAAPEKTFTDEAKAFYERKLPNGPVKKQALEALERDGLKNLKVVVCRNTDKIFHIALPPRSQRALSDDEIQKVAGGEIVTGVGAAIAAAGASVSAIAAVGSAAWVSGGTVLAIASAFGIATAGLIILAGAGVAAELRNKK